MKPHRVRRRRTKGWKLPPNTICVTRPGRWGNPLRIGMYLHFDRAAAVQGFRDWIDRKDWTRSWWNLYGAPPTVEQIRFSLRGKNLACYCPLDQPCHADVLLEIANS